MIVSIKSKKKIKDDFRQIEFTPECGLLTFNMYDGEYHLRGVYFYTDQDGGKVILEERDWEERYSSAKVDALWQATHQGYSDGMTFTEQRKQDLKTALIAVVSSELRWGLNGGDWE